MGYTDITTLACLGSSTTDTFSDIDGKIDSETLKSLLTTSVVTATTNISNDVNIRLDATRDYVSSMSVQEIDQMLIELDERENQILDAVDKTEKVKTLGTKTRF